VFFCPLYYLFFRPLADLYDPDAMPEDLRQAHQRKDEVERIYISLRFTTTHTK
jgi:hypothetical protein